MNPLISIIIPVYNTEKYIRRCIDSVIAQSYSDWELILVDDGSTDGSGKICDEYAEKDERIRVFHKENGGVSSARNVGLDNANGEWVSFVDSDDWIEIGYVETIKNIGNNPDIVFFPMNFRYENGEVLARIPKSVNTEGRDNVERIICNLKYGVINDVFGWVFVKFFKKTIVDEYHIRFDENIRLREDEMFTMDYCRYINSIMVLDKLLYNYQIVGELSLSQKHYDTDNILLAKHIDENLRYYHYEELIKKERQRVAGYYIEKFKKKENFGNMFSAMNEIYDFFNNKPEYKRFAYDQHLVDALSHSRFISFLLLEIRYVMMGLYSRIK